jgi:ATP-binding cassette subfamily F protein uup
VTGYLKDFLFPPERIDSPVAALSGGERNRLLLAKIFTGSANLMVLDEPTNDLDVDTLELLEDLLADYQGTLLLVSHDRAFLDNVVTSTLVFEGRGKIGEYVGGYEDWQRYRRRAAAEPAEPPKRTAQPPAVAAPEEATRVKARKLSYKERRELEALPEKIESLEAERSQLHAAINDPDFYKQPGDKIAAAIGRLQALASEIEASYARWQALEAAAAAGDG